MALLTDRFKAALEALVTRITGKYDYAFAYTYTVQSQNQDGTVELAPDRPEVVPGLSNVKLCYGNPGETVTVAKGARCRVMFENGDPSRPFVLGWEHGGLNSQSLADGTLPVARQGDLVTVQIPIAPTTTPGVSGIPATPTPLFATVYGTISTGAPKVNA